MLIDCKNNTIHCDTNDICIAWVLIHWKINAIHRNINDICTAWVLIDCQKTTLLIVISIIYVLYGC